MNLETMARYTEEVKALGCKPREFGPCELETFFFETIREGASDEELKAIALEEEFLRYRHHIIKLHPEAAF